MRNLDTSADCQPASRSVGPTTGQEMDTLPMAACNRAQRVLVSGVLQLVFGGIFIVIDAIAQPLTSPLMCYVCYWLMFTGIVGCCCACCACGRRDKTLQEPETVFPGGYKFLVVVGILFASILTISGLFLVIIREEGRPQWIIELATVTGSPGLAMSAGVFLAVYQLVTICCFSQSIRTWSTAHSIVIPNRMDTVGFIARDNGQCLDSTVSSAETQRPAVIFRPRLGPSAPSDGLLNDRPPAYHEIMPGS